MGRGAHGPILAESGLAGPAGRRIAGAGWHSEHCVARRDALPRAGGLAVVPVRVPRRRIPPAVAPALSRRRQSERQRTRHDQARCPHGIEIEPAPRHELQPEIAVHEPCEPAARGDHRGRVHGRDDECHPEMRIDEHGCGAVARIAVEAAQPEVDRHQHQPRAVRDRDRERPQAEPRRRDSRERARVPAPDQQHGAEADHERARADPDRRLPREQRGEQPERQHHREDRERMAEREIAERRDERGAAARHQRVRYRERPAHRGIEPVIDAAREHGRPQGDLRVQAGVQRLTDG